MKNLSCHSNDSRYLLVGVLICFLASCMPVGESPTKSIFNIPSHIGKDIDRVKKELGDPEEEFSPDLKNDIGYLSYLKEGWHLSITYKPTTRKVVQFSIHSIPLKRFQKSSDLLFVGTLEPNAFGYVAVPKNMDGYAFEGYTHVTVYPRY